MDPIHVGESFNGIEVLRMLGRSRYGAVYLARDPLIGRFVTLKALPLPPGTAEHGGLSRLVEYTRRIGGLAHPNVSRLHRIHALPEDAGWVLEMEFVEGRSLQSRVRDGPPLAPSEALHAGRALLAGLAAAHGRQVAHGQLGPDRLILGEGEVVKLVDFGIASLIDRDGQAPHPSEDLRIAGDILDLLCDAVEPEEAWPPEALMRLISDCRTCGSSGVSLDTRTALDRYDGIVRAISAPAVPLTRMHREHPRLPGRELELLAIEEALSQTGSARARGLIVEGPRGIGKSTLLAEAVRLARGFGAHVLQVDVGPGESSARRLLEAARDSLATEIGQFTSEARAGRAAAARRLVEEADRVREGSPESTFPACEGLLRSIATGRSVVIALDGADAGGAGDTRVLTELLRRFAQTRLLLIATLETGPRSGSAPRPGDPGPALALAALPHVRRLPLRPLDAGALFRLIEERTDGCEPSIAVVQQFLDISEGNPLLAVELLDHLLERGDIEPVGRTLHAVHDLQEVPLPPSYGEFFSPDLDRIDPAGLELLQVAAVDGSRFDGRAVAFALGRPPLMVLRELQSLQRRTGLLLFDTDGYRFQHGVLRELLYRDLPPERRGELHRILATHLEERDDDEPAEPARLARHWEGAGEPERARPYYIMAVAHAQKRKEVHRSLDFARRAGLEPGRIEPGEAATHAELLLKLAASHSDLGDTSAAESIFDDLERAARERKDSALLQQVQVRRARMKFVAGGPAAVDEQDLRRLGDEIPEGPLRAAAYHLLGTLAKHRGRLDEAWSWLEEARRLQESSGETTSLATSLDQLASVAMRDGRIQEAGRLHRKGAQLCRAAGLDADAALHDLHEALCGYAEGTRVRLAESFDRCQQRLALAGRRNKHAHIRVLRAEVVLAEGHRDRALELLDGALSVLSRATYLPGLVPAHLLSTRLAIMEGDLERAAEHRAETIRLAARNRDRGAGAEARMLEAMRLYLQGSSRQALAMVQEALAHLDARADRRSMQRMLETLAEALAYGLPAASLVEEQVLVGTDWSGTAAEERTERLLWGGIALADGSGSIHDLHAAAHAATDPALGPGTALLGALGGWMAAEAARRAGDFGATRSLAADAREAAAKLGHVWLEAALAGLLAELETMDG